MSRSESSIRRASEIRVRITPPRPGRLGSAFRVSQMAHEMKSPDHSRDLQRTKRTPVDTPDKQAARLLLDGESSHSSVPRVGARGSSAGVSDGRQLFGVAIANSSTPLVSPPTSHQRLAGKF